MIAHHVLFWLKPETTEAEKLAFKDGLESLKDIEVVKHFHAGTPAPIERAVVDTTYTFSLLLLFDDLAAHDTYQVHPLHKAFLEQFRIFFERVVIYDAH
ncbi:transcription-repair coupling factor [Pedobacter yulinensis]|uniref:Transcription-repair coupling factor n=1 Tax=Pedobacter yulinensis TaxID=2126353 RepID=A0A2T3HGT5_9SPHI|nr:Dabb family protein [Pedobacter yulinensis]PST81613.1 transcription-repair coupling factor [Pedobacter yulinensis]